MNRPPQVIVGAKLPLRPMHVWAIRVRLQIERRLRDLALFDIALDSKLRGCDVVSLRLPDILAAGALRRRAIVTQQKTGRPVQFEITEQVRGSLADWLRVKRGEPMAGCSQVAWSGRAPLNATIYSPCERLDCAHWLGTSRIRHPQLEADESLDALS